MTDVHDSVRRSYNMSQIKAKNTKPEMILREFLFNAGFRYRIHSKKLPGKPDVVLLKYKIAIFVNGCFGHGHENCKYATIPKTRPEFWKAKISANKERDIKNNFKLLDEGWKIITIFDCQLKGEKKKSTLDEVITQIH